MILIVRSKVEFCSFDFNLFECLRKREKKKTCLCRYIIYQYVKICIYIDIDIYLENPS